MEKRRSERQEKHCACAQSVSHVQLCNPTDGSPPGSSVHGISQARMLEGVAISSSRGSSDPGIELVFPALASRFLTTEPPGKPMKNISSM